MWYIDIRNFRSINPQYGFMRGNSVLSIVAHNIKDLLSHDLPVARLGADRFVPLSAGLTFEQAEERFQQLIQKTNDDLAKVGIHHNLILVAGIYYLRPEDLQSANHQKPLDYVSIAHRNTRENSKSSLVLFTDEDLERDVRRITIEQTIDEALLDGQIQVWYQP